MTGVYNESTQREGERERDRVGGRRAEGEFLDLTSRPEKDNQRGYGRGTAQDSSDSQKRSHRWEGQNTGDWRVTACITTQCARLSKFWHITPGLCHALEQQSSSFSSPAHPISAGTVKCTRCNPHRPMTYMHFATVWVLKISGMLRPIRYKACIVPQWVVFLLQTGQEWPFLISLRTVGNWIYNNSNKVAVFSGGTKLVIHSVSVGVSILSDQYLLGRK